MNIRSSLIRSMFFVGTLAGQVEYKNIYIEPTALELTLEHAAITGNVSELQALINAGINLNAHVWSEHVLARVLLSDIANKEEIVTLFLENGINPNHVYADDQPILWIAVERGDLALVQLLLDYGAAPNIQYNRMPLLVRAMYYQDLQIVYELLDFGADPNETGFFGVLPLKIATFNKNRGLAELLIQYGADFTLLFDDEQIKLERLLRLPVYF